MTESVPGRKLRVTSVLKERKLLIALAVILAGVAVFLFWNRGLAKSGTYLTQDVTRGDVVNAITASGVVEAENSVPLIFKNSAVIKAIYVKEGQQVKKGDLLAEQDDSDLRAQYQQQQANLKSAEAKLALARAGSTREEIRQSEENVNIARISYDQAKLNNDRYSTLFAQGAASVADKEKAEGDYKLAEAKYNQAQSQLKSLQAGSRPEDILTAEAQVESARAQLESAQNNLNSARLTAPNDGVIGLVGAVVGQRTNGAGSSASSEDGFITLISDRLRVRAQVNEADIGRTAVGQKASFTVNSFPGKKFPGVVETISPKAVTVSNVQLYEVIIALEQQENGLKVGMPANVGIVVDQKAGVTLLPKIAVSYATQQSAKTSNQPGQGAAQNKSQGEIQGNTSRQGPAGGKAQNSGGSRAVSVLVIEGGQAVSRQVQVGLSDNTNYEVVSGLKEGDKVVIGNTAQSSGSVTSTTGNTNRQGFGGQGLPMGGPPR